MFGFFTVVLLIYFIATFKNDNSKRMLKYHETFQMNFDNMTDENIKFAFAQIGYWIILIVMSITHMIYLLNAIKVDIYRYPTYIMITLVVIGIIQSKISSSKTNKVTKHMTKEAKLEYNIAHAKQFADEYKKLHNVAFRYMTRVMSVGYYGYMLWIVFIR